MAKQLSLFCASLTFVISGCMTDKKQEVKLNPASEEEIPLLTKAKVRSYVVPDTIEGNKFIKSHKIYILEDPGSWTK